jgi:TRAP-type uncharacterized transport system fused permease subunit
MLSFITPPVAIGAYAAAALAGANPMVTAIQAVRLGAVKYCIPFFVVFAPALILHGNFSEVFLAIVTAVIGVVFLASGIEGYLVFFGQIRMFGRVCAFFGGLLLFVPGWKTNILGACLIAIPIIERWFFKISQKSSEKGTP